jgi:hypothetical protein
VAAAVAATAVVEEATAADAGMAGKDAAAKPNSLTKSARRGGAFLFFTKRMYERLQ